MYFIDGTYKATNFSIIIRIITNFEAFCADIGSILTAKDDCY